MLKHIIAPACEKGGFDDPIRSDKMDESGFITTQIIDHLIGDAVVIADLSDHNPNVFYELAIRHAFRKPVIQLIQRGEDIPFDVAGLRTVEVDVDLDVAEAAREQILKHLVAIREKRDDVHSPVSVAWTRPTSRGNEQERQLAEVLRQVAEARFHGSISRKLAGFNRDDGTGTAEDFFKMPQGPGGAQAAAVGKLMAEVFRLHDQASAKLTNDPSLLAPEEGSRWAARNRP